MIPAPLARVTLSGTDTVTLMSAPLDAASQPRAGQVIELLPWSAVLENGEIVADEYGFFTKVVTDYDPTTQQLIVESLPDLDSPGNPDDDDFVIQWAPGHPDLGGQTAGYFYMRVWYRGEHEDDVAQPSEITMAGSSHKLHGAGAHPRVFDAQRRR